MHITQVREFPPKEGANILVRFEFLYGIWISLVFDFSASFVMT